MKSLLFVILSIQTYSLFAQSPNLDLSVYEIRNTNPSYLDFCKRWPGECDLSGEQQIAWTPDIESKIKSINQLVNESINFSLDQDIYEREEYWNYPIGLAGDCEDNALEKRRVLVEHGLPRGALRMTTAFHKNQYYAHALLLIETTRGTFVLDQDSEKVLIWHQAPYIFEAREMADGRWERFEQDWKRN